MYQNIITVNVHLELHESDVSTDSSITQLRLKTFKYIISQYSYSDVLNCIQNSVILRKKQYNLLLGRNNQHFSVDSSCHYKHDQYPHLVLFVLGFNA